MPPMKETDLQQGICKTALEHHGKILQNLNKLRQNSAFCDVEVSAGDGFTVKVICHQLFAFIFTVIYVQNMFLFVILLAKFFY